MILPRKGERVPLETIYDICITYKLWDLMGNIKDNPPSTQFVSDG